MFYKTNTGDYRTLLPGIEMKTLVHGKQTLLSKFKLAKGTVVPMHQHPQEQTGYLILGRLRFDVDGEIIDAHPGDSWNLAADIPHGADVLEDSVVIEVFSPVREDYLP